MLYPLLDSLPLALGAVIREEVEKPDLSVFKQVRGDFYINGHGQFAYRPAPPAKEKQEEKQEKRLDPSEILPHTSEWARKADFIIGKPPASFKGWLITSRLKASGIMHAHYWDGTTWLGGGSETQADSPSHRKLVEQGEVHYPNHQPHAYLMAYPVWGVK